MYCIHIFINNNNNKEKIKYNTSVLETNTIHYNVRIHYILFVLHL